MKRSLLVIISLLFTLVSPEEAYSQDKKPVTGIVTAFKQIPLNKVKITAANSGQVSFSDSLGRFSIECFVKDELVFTAAGFEKKKTKVGKDDTYVIDLGYKISDANFNSAVSNGHISEEALKKSIDMVNIRIVKDYSKYSSIYQLISSELYEVSVKGTGIYSKKVRSSNINPQVLYVVDNKIVSDISFVNTTYVKSIEFVDDVGSTMYGSMGANGVIRITLK